MSKSTILMLGGYGGIGRVIARLLLKETRADLVIAGRDKKRADEFSEALNREFPGDRVCSRDVEASNRESLLEAFRDAKLVMVLVPRPDLVRQIALAALNSGCDYLDILVSESTVRDLGELASAIERQGRTFITQAGFHPGLPAVFVRHAAQYFDQYEKAIIAMAMNTRFENPGQAAEIIPMVADFSADICRGSVWRKATYKDRVTLDMGARFGSIELYPIQMVEIRQTQERFNLSETGVYVSGFNRVVDHLIFPIIFITQWIRKGFALKLVSRLFAWGVNTFSSPDQGVVFMNHAEGLKDGKRIEVKIIAEHDDAYLFTAIPVIACLKQYFDGTLPLGLGMMGHVVDEKLLFSDMAKMGAKIRTEIRAL